MFTERSVVIKVLAIIVWLSLFSLPSMAINAGDPIGEPFMGIQAKSNGANTRKGEGVYQCVDLAKKFAAVYHTLINIEVGSAANMWNVLPSSKGYQAYRIAGKFWEYYRYGRDSRYGPDIPMDDGTVLGVPTSDFINGQQCFQNGYCKSGSVELHRLDGTLVEVFEPTGEFSALTLSGKPMSENHNTIEWLGGPACDYYAVFGNGTEIGQTTLREFTEAGLPTGSTRQYQVVAMSNSTGALDASNVVTITGPGNPGSFALQGAPDGYNSAFLQWQNTAYPYAPFLWLFRDGIKIAKLVSDFNQRGDYPLEPNHSYTYQVAAITASEMILGWSNPVTVVTDPAPEPPIDTLFNSATIMLEYEINKARNFWAFLFKKLCLNFQRNNWF